MNDYSDLSEMAKNDDHGAVLVTGATGRQGGAVADQLLERGFRVRALTRSPDRAAARRLADKGAELVRGDLEDVASLEAAADGAWGVFSVQDPWAHGVVAEIRQGMALADAAKRSGVEHFVYTSVATAERRTGVPHFESKGIIERHVARSGLRFTVIRPVFFMDMLVKRFEPRSGAMWAMLWAALGRRRTAQLISARDIGRLAVEAFSDPERWAGRYVELAADELTMPELRRTFLEIVGHAPPPLPLPLPIVGLVNEEARINFDWMRDEGWHVDIAALRSELPWLTPLSEWLRSL